MKVSEKAYTAGLLDGEGSITSHVGGSGRCYIHISIAQTVRQNSDVLEWLKKTWGGTVNIQNRNRKLTANVKQLKIYRPGDGKAMLRFLLKTLPFLQVKKLQARVAISMLLVKHQLGRLTGYGYQNTSPPPQLKQWDQNGYYLLRDLNSSDTPPAETECENFIKIGKMLIQIYGRKVRQAHLDEEATVRSCTMKSAAN